MMDGLLELSVTALSVTFGGGAGFFFVKWLFEFVGGRMDKRADRLDAGTAELIAQLQAQVKGLIERENALLARVGKVEEDLRECKSKHAESEAEVTRLKSVLQGMGDGRQHAALIVASEKAKEKGS